MNSRGRKAEQEARRYLEQEGLQCLVQNMHCRVGEIDLIMRHGEELAFVEVRARAAGASVDALSSVHSHKRQRIIRAAKFWLGRNPQWFDRPLRFDIVAIDGDALQWHRNAFDAA